jgi:MFS superfamily sulfate permease-like transporter
MFNEILKWDNSLTSFLLLGVIAVLVSIIVIWITSIFAKDKPHSIIRGIINGVLIAIVVFLVNNLELGFRQNKGEEIKPKNQDVETLTLTAQELTLQYKIDEMNDTFYFIMDKRKIDPDNWVKELTRLLTLYKNLKTVNVVNASQIPYNLIVELNKIDREYEDIIFTGLTGVIDTTHEPIEEITFLYDTNRDKYILNGEVVDINDFTRDFKDKLEGYQDLQIVVIKKPEEISDFVKEKLRIIERQYTKQVEFVWEDD